MSADGDHVTNPAQLRDVITKMPPIAFEIAREMKELLQRVEQIEFDGGVDEGLR